jgi:hypothetical protein
VRSFYLCRTHFREEAKLEKEEEKKKGKEITPSVGGLVRKKIEGGGRYGIRARVEEGILPSNNFVFIFIFIFFFALFYFLFSTFGLFFSSFSETKEKEREKERKKKEEYEIANAVPIPPPTPFATPPLPPIRPPPIVIPYREREVVGR